MFRQLSFDTSSADVHIALFEDGASVREDILCVEGAAAGAGRQEAANLLIPGIDRLMRDAAWSKADLDCIIVGTGPGGFTGIRTSVVTARTLAQALQLPLFPVSILECIGSALPGVFAIALYATVGHYFLAKNTADGITSSYVQHSDLADSLKGTPLLYADSRAKVELSRSEETILLASSMEIRDLPKIPNIAVQQAQFAWRQLSLKVADFYERLSELNVSKANESQPLHLKLHASLSHEFPYERVVPTYLRAPSVTVKKTNV